MWPAMLTTIQCQNPWWKWYFPWHANNHNCNSQNQEYHFLRVIATSKNTAAVGWVPVCYHKGVGMTAVKLILISSKRFLLPGTGMESKLLIWLNGAGISVKEDYRPPVYTLLHFEVYIGNIMLSDSCMWELLRIWLHKLWMSFFPLEKWYTFWLK